MSTEVWTVEVRCVADPGAGLHPRPVPDRLRSRSFLTEAVALTAAKSAAIPGWDVTVIEPDGSRWGL